MVLQPKLAAISNCIMFASSKAPVPLYPEDVLGHTRFLVGLWARASNIFDRSDHFLFDLDCVSIFDLQQGVVVC